IVIVEYGIFFFQVEDGIRDRNVTGVQTCALPICGVMCWGWKRLGLALTQARSSVMRFQAVSPWSGPAPTTIHPVVSVAEMAGSRSEERRVGRDGGGGGRRLRVLRGGWDTRRESAR